MFGDLLDPSQENGVVLTRHDVFEPARCCHLNPTTEWLGDAQRCQADAARKLLMKKNPVFSYGESQTLTCFIADCHEDQTSRLLESWLPNLTV